MRILLVHNTYQQPGGEDVAFRNEMQLLRSAGVKVRDYLDDNRRIDKMNQFRVGIETVWSESSRRHLAATLSEFQPKLVHFHNTFPLISPAAYSACWDMGIPVVQTLHNYRLLCPSAVLFRNGRVCEDCLRKDVKWPAVLHGCYRNSRLFTATVATMLAVHHSLSTWRKGVDQYIALSKFSRQKFVEGGLPAEKIAVKPNFVPADPGVRHCSGDFALFVGRLAVEKGPQLLVRAWKIGKFSFPLRFVGDGPLREDLQREIAIFNLHGIVFDGWLNSSAVSQLMKRARCVVLPSLWFEAFPMTLVEAFACGVPVIVPRHGAMAEIVEDRVTGLHFEPGSAEDLATKLDWAWTHQQEVGEMGRAARLEYERRYTAERNLPMLLDIYNRVLDRDSDAVYEKPC